MFVNNVNDLRIYQAALNLSGEINHLMKTVPLWWKIREIDQVVRSSDSVPANISEGFSHRFYPKQFFRYLIISLGSSDETQTHLNILAQKNLIKECDFKRFSKEYKNLSIQILNFTNHIRRRHNLPKNIHS